MFAVSTCAARPGSTRLCPAADEPRQSALAIDVFTGTSTVALPEALCQELAVRLAQFGAPDAAERLLGPRSIRTEDKPVVREVVGRWLRSGGADEFELELLRLQTLLGSELERIWRIDRR